MPEKQAPNSKLGDMQAMVRVLRSAVPGDLRELSTLEQKRKLLARLCLMVGEQIGNLPRDRRMACLPRRQRQTLEFLLAGDSEKQVARKLSISHHTVHQYVKSLYKHFKVSGRSELLASFVTQRA